MMSATQLSSNRVKCKDKTEDKVSLPVFKIMNSSEFVLRRDFENFHITQSLFRLFLLKLSTRLITVKFKAIRGGVRTKFLWVDLKVCFTLRTMLFTELSFWRLYRQCILLFYTCYYILILLFYVVFFLHIVKISNRTWDIWFWNLQFT